jgi:hypothetical protein
MASKLYIVRATLAFCVAPRTSLPAVEAALLDAHYEPLKVSVELSPPALELHRGPFYTLAATIKPRGPAVASQEAYLRISARTPSRSPMRRTTAMLSLVSEGASASVTDGMVVLSAIAGPLRLSSDRNACHAQDKGASRSLPLRSELTAQQYRLLGC